MSSPLPSFQDRLTIIMLPIALLGIAAVFVVMLFARPIIIESLAEKYLNRMGEYINDDMEFVLLVNDPIAISDYLKNTIDIPWIASATLYQTDGSVKFTAGYDYEVAFDDDRLELENYKYMYQKQRPLLTSELGNGESKQAYLGLVLNGTELNNTANKAYATLTIIMIVVSIALIAFAIRLTKVASQSITELNQDIASYQAENTTHSQIFREPDSYEIQSLQKVLLDSYKSDAEQRELLESAVKTRTAELSSVMESNRIAGEIRNNLIMNLSHDLRTPLTSNIGYLNHVIESLEIDKGANEEDKDRLNILTKARHHSLLLSNEINTLMQYSISGDISTLLKSELVDVEKLVENSMQISDQLRQSSNNTFEYNHKGERTLHTSRRLLQFILDNLISNSHKYCSDGLVSIQTNVSDDGFELTVADTGRGIASDELDLIFDKHYQASSAKISGVKGGGIGLSLAQLWVSLLDGSIEVNTDVNKHTVFRVCIPCKIS